MQPQEGEEEHDAERDAPQTQLAPHQPVSALCDRREGQVRRTDEQGIVAVRSQRNAASNDRSTEFYALFLSWWEKAKQDG